MINLRYHIVSIVAVFLALGIGVLMGSTIVDRALVDNLNGQLDGLQENLERAQEDNQQLEGELNRAAELQVGLNDEATPQMLRGRLAGVPVVLVAVEGVSESAVEDLDRFLEGAGAVVGSPLWLTDKLRLESDDDARSLAAVLEHPVAEPSRLRPALAARLALLLQAAGAGEGLATDPVGETDPGPTPTTAPDPGADEGSADDPTTPTTEEPVTTTTTTVDPTVAGRDVARAELSTLIGQLTADGFVRTDGEGGLGAIKGAAVVVVGGSGASLPDGQLATPLVTALGAGPVRSVVAAETIGPALEAGGPGVRGRFVGPLRRDELWRGQTSTVDDLETFPGRAAVVLAIEDLARGVVGHYGLGEDAQRLLPALPS